MASATWPRWSRDVDPGRSRMAGAPAVRQPVQDGVPRGVSVIQRRQPSSARRLSRSRCRHADARTLHSPSSRRYTWVARRGIAAGDRRSKPRSARGRRCRPYRRPRHRPAAQTRTRCSRRTSNEESEGLLHLRPTLRVAQRAKDAHGLVRTSTGLDGPIALGVERPPPLSPPLSPSGDIRPGRWHDDARDRESVSRLCWSAAVFSQPWTTTTLTSFRYSCDRRSGPNTTSWWPFSVLRRQAWRADRTAASCMPRSAPVIAVSGYIGQMSQSGSYRRQIAAPRPVASSSMCRM
jgi:hypothetical protein